MVKMIGRHSIKRAEKRSAMMGDILLYEADTGILKALMDAEYNGCRIYYDFENRCSGSTFRFPVHLFRGGVLSD